MANKKSSSEEKVKADMLKDNKDQRFRTDKNEGSSSPNLTKIRVPIKRTRSFNERTIIDELLKVDLSDIPYSFPLQYLTCVSICTKSKRLFLREDSLLKLNGPIRVCSDLHGQFSSLKLIFATCGYPPNTRYLFLGNYVNRGRMSTEVFLLLLLYKISYPDSIFLLRGNHESNMLSSYYGLRDEIVSKFGNARLFRHFIRTFDSLPLAAITEDRIFCCHGGLSPCFLDKKCTSLAEAINRIRRPCKVPNTGLLCDLLWADPVKQEGNKFSTGWIRNERSYSWKFGEDVVKNFTAKFTLDLVVRGHQFVFSGVEYFADKKLITLNSAPSYFNELANTGAVLCIDRRYPDKMKVITEKDFSSRKSDETFYDEVQGVTIEVSFDLLAPYSHPDLSNNRFPLNYRPTLNDPQQCNDHEGEFLKSNEEKAKDWYISEVNYFADIEPMTSHSDSEDSELLFYLRIPKQLPKRSIRGKNSMRKRRRFRRTNVTFPFPGGQHSMVE